MNTSKVFRLVSTSGEVSEVIRKFDSFVNQYHPIFKMACIRQMDVGRIPNDPTKDDYYPLKLYADIDNGNGTKESVEVWVSEVRCGYNGESSDALISILQKTKLPFKNTDKPKIYTSRKLYMTIFDGSIMKSY